MQVCECVLPPQTSPLMSSHWRSSHSQFLPWMRLSPAGWQVHWPHRQRPKKTKNKKIIRRSFSFRFSAFWPPRASKASFDRRSHFSLIVCLDWLLKVFRPATAPTASREAVAVGLDLSMQMAQTHPDSPRDAANPPPPGRPSLIIKTSCSLTPDPKVKCIPAHWSVHQDAGGGGNPLVSDKLRAVFLCERNIYPDSLLIYFIFLPPQRDLIPGLHVLIHGDKSL